MRGYLSGHYRHFIQDASIGAEILDEADLQSPKDSVSPIAGISVTSERPPETDTEEQLSSSNSSSQKRRASETDEFEPPAKRADRLPIKLENSITQFDDDGAQLVQELLEVKCSQNDSGTSRKSNCQVYFTAFFFLAF
ncbi:unnamed protein product [Gongylonema pulchrum]|uniref:Uncharacterized protein n=1 Tax=Gongylonema pulchrum TaxID=637853 RepID=A0A183EK64_9BILA|nr:unnamed protein product [Gongylonema pulchrum]